MQRARESRGDAPPARRYRPRVQRATGRSWVGVFASYRQLAYRLTAAGSSSFKSRRRAGFKSDVADTDDLELAYALRRHHLGNFALTAADQRLGDRAVQRNAAFLHVRLVFADDLPGLLDRKSTRLNSSH